MEKDYCTQHHGDCESCSLASYGRDCRNNPIGAAGAAERRCVQCGRNMNPVEWMLGATCGQCCRRNHRRVAGL